MQANEEFFKLLQRKVIIEKSAFILHELLIDIAEMSIDAGLSGVTIKQTSNLKTKLEHRFHGLIGFETLNYKLIVYPMDVNPCFYVFRPL